MKPIRPNLLLFSDEFFSVESGYFVQDGSWKNRVFYPTINYEEYTGTLTGSGDLTGFSGLSNAYRFLGSFDLSKAYFSSKSGTYSPADISGNFGLKRLPSVFSSANDNEAGGDNPFKACQASVLLTGEPFFGERYLCEGTVSDEFDYNTSYNFTVESASYLNDSISFSGQKQTIPSYKNNGEPLLDKSGNQVYQTITTGIYWWYWGEIEKELKRIRELDLDYPDPPYSCYFPKPHCERLCFVRNFSSETEEKDFLGWFKPGGSQSNSAPIPQNEVLYGPPITPCWNPSLVYNTGTGSGSRESFDIGYTGTEDDPRPHGVSGMQKWMLAHKVDQGFDINEDSYSNPGFADPYVESETWSYCPTKLGREKDKVFPIHVERYITGASGEEFSFHDLKVEGGLLKSIAWPAGYLADYTVKWEWSDEIGGYQDPVATRLEEHFYGEGNYDWRFLNAFISRWKGNYKSESARRRHDDLYISVDWSKMYWDTANPINKMPTGPEWLGASGLRKEIEERIYEPNGPFPSGTLVDLKIHAVVKSMQISQSVISDFPTPYKLIILTNTGRLYRVWHSTDFYISARQSMPIPSQTRWVFPNDVSGV